jgi:hypothetical protein
MCDRVSGAVDWNRKLIDSQITRNVHRLWTRVMSLGVGNLIHVPYQWDWNDLDGIF